MSTRSAWKLTPPCYICLAVAKLIGLVVPDIELIGLCHNHNQVTWGGSITAMSIESSCLACLVSSRSLAHRSVPFGLQIFRTGRPI